MNSRVLCVTKNPRFGERDSRGQKVVRSDAPTGGFRMGERRDGAGVASPKYLYRRIGIEQVPAHRLGRGSNRICGGLAKSSSTRPIA